MVVVLVGEQNFCDLLRLVAQRRKSLHIAANILSGVEDAVLVRHLLGSTCGQTRINKNDLVAGVNQIVLQTAAVANALVEFLCTFLAAENKGLRIESVFSEFYCFDLHNFLLTAKAAGAVRQPSL